ncbi:very short patch repair endonuclease [Nitrincola sp. MINF-07-Sa-05]|uniref:very short patch repair endonuclease n=1 Tax=Nitrincola salilacus TaxID=3400273 RepID=UPI00391856D6
MIERQHVSSTRSRNMSAIRGKDTKPEVQVRRFLHSCGFRFRLQSSRLPGKPDLVLKKYRLAIFVHGCFWHRHADCFYTSTPVTRADFWNQKFSQNIERDRKVKEQLLAEGWRVLVIWECGMKCLHHEMHELSSLINGNELSMEWPALPPRQRS